MNAEFKAGKITFELHDLLGQVSTEQKMEMIESMSCDDDVIKHVSAQIISRWTENGYAGGSACTASDAPTMGLDWACREVAKHSGEIAKREIERLEDALRCRNSEVQDLLNELSAARRNPLYS